MERTVEATRMRNRWSQRWQMPARRAVIPSWFVSVALHAVLLFLFATTLKSCGTVPFSGEGESRSVGIYLKEARDAAPSPSLDESPTEDQQDASAKFAAASESSRPRQSDDAPPSELLDLPPVAKLNPVIGPGAAAAAPRSFAPGDVSELLRPSGISSPQALKADVGEVPFFGLKETGTRFVYLLDSSGSMMNHNAIRVAKAELMASLQSLDATQQFQIIFYNTSAQSMTQRSDPEKLYWATDINRTIARQFISGIQPDGGTSHVPAIKKALKFNPEVLFFLTDADEPQLSAAEMDEIHKLNRGGTRIHCVEFGKGPDLSVDNFLKKLARQNNGLYQYRDVTKFDR